MAPPTVYRAVSTAILIEDIQFPISATRSSLTMTSPAPIATSPARTPPHPACLPAVLLSTPKFYDRDLTKLPSLPASGSRKRKGASRRPKAVETRRTRVRTKLRGVAQAATKSKGFKIKIPAQKAAKRLRTSSRINIDALPPSATSPSAPHDMDDPPQKLTITIPAITKMADSETPLLVVNDLQTPAASVSQEYPVTFKIRIPPLIRLPYDDQNVHLDVSGPDNTERPSQVSSGRPRRIAPLPKKYRQGV